MVVDTNAIIDLTVQVYDGVTPYEQCSFWGGTKDSGSGPAPLDVYDNPVSATPGQPYILVDTLCTLPNGPWFLGIDNTVADLKMNGFVGVVTLFTQVTDAAGTERQSNILTFISGFFSFVAGLTDDPENQSDGSSTVSDTSSSRWVYE
jgi:hypothetical protein